MYVSQQEKIIYLANPKSASQATSGALCRNLVDMRRFGPHHNYPNQAANATLGYDPEDPEWLVITNVRNHFDAIVSWHFHYQAGMPFSAEFVDTLPVSVLKSYFPRKDSLWHLMCQHANRVVHMESLEPELNAVLAERGLGPIAVPVAHASEARQGRPYQEFYDEETRERVEEVYGEEMALYGYTWEDA